MEYTQLDRTTQLNMVKARIRDLEQQYFTLDLRVKSPDLTNPLSQADQSNLTRLEDGLNALHQMEKELSSQSS